MEWFGDNWDKTINVKSKTKFPKSLTHNEIGKNYTSKTHNPNSRFL